MIYSQTTLMRMQKRIRSYKLVTSLPEINAYQWNSAYYQLDSSHLENLLKCIFKMRVIRKFDFRRIWKFWWGLSNVISRGNSLFRWDCVFSGGTLYSSANYELTWHMRIPPQHILSFKKKRVAEGVSKYLPTKHAMKLRKFWNFSCLLKGGRGRPGWRGGAGVQFLQKKKVN